MRYQLINPVNSGYSAIEQILTNRKIPFNEIHHYLNTTEKDINSPLLFGADVMKNAAATLIKSIKNQEDALIIVDCDCDGYTSAAILINYLYDLFPTWVENHLKYFLHEDKTHGLSDTIDYIEMHNFKLILVPDAGSNDYEYHNQLRQEGKQIIILDHHGADKVSTDAIIINNQLSNYPNKELSGAGVVWQFCRYLDSLLQVDNAKEYVDLVALGLTGDMMSLRSFETKEIIQKGFLSVNIKNPFIYGMAEKNSYSLGGKITPMGAAFYIVPFINSMVRSGTLEEKELLFNSMLKNKAFLEVLSNKRGHKLGETERLVDQAIRTAVNVKSRQTKAQDIGMQLVESRIKNQNMMKHKILLFLLEPGEIDHNIAGLIANKIMAKYQRPVLMLIDYDGIYQGSARGYSKSGITDFKQICLDTHLVEYAQGHPNAFGLGIKKENVTKFINETDNKLKNLKSEPLYYVDYIFKGVDVNPNIILDIANLSDLWGQDVDQSLIAIEDLKVTKDNLTLMSPDKRPTLKIVLPNKVNLIKFGSSQEEYDKLYSNGYVDINVVGTCNQNNWNGNVSPQIFISDYEIVGQSKYNF